jgi:hypothetical protein
VGVVIGFIETGIESCGSDMEWGMVIGFIVRGIGSCGCDMASLELFIALNLTAAPLQWGRLKFNRNQYQECLTGA